MTFRQLLNQTCTRHRLGSPTVDAEGEWVTQVTESTATYPCRLDRASSNEEREGQPSTTAEWVLFLPPDADIAADDTVTVDDVDYRVIGEPWKAAGRSATHHIEARLRVTR